jgi:hypothetical protein
LQWSRCGILFQSGMSETALALEAAQGSLQTDFVSCVITALGWAMQCCTGPKQDDSIISVSLQQGSPRCSRPATWQQTGRPCVRQGRDQIRDDPYMAVLQIQDHVPPPATELLGNHESHVYPLCRIAANDEPGEVRFV